MEKTERFSSRVISVSYSFSPCLVPMICTPVSPKSCCTATASSPMVPASDFCTNGHGGDRQKDFVHRLCAGAAENTERGRSPGFACPKANFTSSTASSRFIRNLVIFCGGKDSCRGRRGLYIPQYQNSGHGGDRQKDFVHRLCAGAAENTERGLSRAYLKKRSSPASLLFPYSEPANRPDREAWEELASITGHVLPQAFRVFSSVDEKPKFSSIYWETFLGLFTPAR